MITSLPTRLLLITSMVIVFLFSMGKTVAYAQSLKMELVNPTQQISVGNTFQVKLLINTGNIEAINADALLTFEPTKVSVDSATTANFFTYFSSSPLSGNPNQYLISSWEESVAHAKKSSTDTIMATLSLTANAAGSTSLGFVCTPGTEADSNINRASDSQDILTNCTALTPLTLTIGGGGTVNPTSTPGAGQPTSTPGATVEPTATPIPTATPTLRPTNTPRPTSPPPPSVTTLPRAGTVGTTMAAFGMAAALLTVGGLLFIL